MGKASFIFGSSVSALVAVLCFVQAGALLVGEPEKAKA